MRPIPRPSLTRDHFRDCSFPRFACRIAQAGLYSHSSRREELGQENAINACFRCCCLDESYGGRMCERGNDGFVRYRLGFRWWDDGNQLDEEYRPDRLRICRRFLERVHGAHPERRQCRPADAGRGELPPRSSQPPLDCSLLVIGRRLFSRLPHSFQPQEPDAELGRSALRIPALFPNPPGHS
jgi:hypothetical protein